MNEDVISDLKQFITVTVSQRISDVREDIQKLDKKLSSKIDDLSNSIAEAMTDSHEEVDKQLQDHETRITALESKSA